MIIDFASYPRRRQPPSTLSPAALARLAADVCAAPPSATRIGYQPGLPSALVPDQLAIDQAADAVALLAGRELDDLSPEMQDRTRAFAILAAAAVHPDGLLWIGYAMLTYLMRDVAALRPAERRAHARQLAEALCAAAQRANGVANPHTTEAMVALIASDHAPEAQ